jgi:hypothetical protein
MPLVQSLDLLKRRVTAPSFRRVLTMHGSSACVPTR